MPLNAGTKLGPYEIISPIGAGGMGEVYRARDSRLGREVALKILPPQFADHPEALQRFEREARAVSSLSHPNICALYDVGSQDGTEYLVMEFLEGETLAKRLEKGSLPMEQVLKIGASIADALDKAHRKGIVHRDLKPGNVMLTKAGPKLLDFGLAKSATGVVVSTETLATMSVTPGGSPRGPLTAQGTILGTWQYMSPEQAEGKDVDARSDIFSFGAMVYEMATGRRAFEGKSSASVIAAILEREVPPVSSIQPLAPAGFDRIVKKCLAKDPDDRWQNAGDLCGELKWLTESSSQSNANATPPTPSKVSKKSVAMVGWALAGLLAVAVLALLASKLASDPNAPRKSITLAVDGPEGVDLSVYGDGMVAISPDGHYLAFVGSEAGIRHLWLRDMYNGESKKLSNTVGATFPFWSPDNRFVGFFADDNMKVLTLDGGSIRTVTPAVRGRGASWGKNGTILFSPNIDSGLFQIDSAGGEPQALSLVSTGGDTRLPTFLPDAKHFLYVVRSEGLYGAVLGDKQGKLLVKGASNGLYSKGFLIYVREGNLLAQSFDPEKLELRGQPRALASDMGDFNGRNYAVFTVSDNGPLLYRKGGIRAQLTWFDRHGTKLGTVGPVDLFSNIAFSPDQKRLLVDRGVINGQMRVWMFDLEHDSLSSLESRASLYSVWSPDGEKVALTGVESQNIPNAVFVREIANGKENLFYNGPGEHDVTDWSRDGKFVMTEHAGNGVGSELWVLPTDGTKPYAYLTGSYSICNGRFSPDTKWVAYTSDESGQQQIYVQSFPAGHGKWQISNHGGDQPQWRSDAKELFYMSPDRKLMSVPIKLGASVEAATPVPLFETTVPYGAMNDYRNNYAGTHNGEKFLVNTLDERAGQRPFTAIVNWESLLNK